jgi:Multicopper oxidase
MADGVKRSFLSLNSQLPGPQINVCKDDIIVVDLHNNAEGTATSIHWHGIRQTKDTQFFDGTPYLTQVINFNFMKKQHLLLNFSHSFYSVRFRMEVNFDMRL